MKGKRSKAYTGQAEKGSDVVYMALSGRKRLFYQGTT